MSVLEISVLKRSLFREVSILEKFVYWRDVCIQGACTSILFMLIFNTQVARVFMEIKVVSH